MPSCAKLAKVLLWMLLISWCCPVLANQFGVKVRHVKLVDNDQGYRVDAEIDYQLSPLAREALEKGVPLSWNVRVEIRRPGLLWTPVIYKQKLRYTLQYHALLKQYEVKAPDNHLEMFLTLNAALNFMSIPKQNELIDKQLIAPEQRYQLAIRSQFHRESLPAPLRPFAYLNQQWFLSSPWFIWPIQK